ncbi:MAG: hypothetical protein N2378_04315 [Chloroflexaceae bacterium]|nr:hypothetical protein [Chloroflexaceae bacterium]
MGKPLERLAAPIRVLLADVPDALAEELTALMRHEPDLYLVGRVVGGIEVLLAAEAVDVVVIGAPDVHRLPAVVTHLLGEYPDLKILALATDGTRLAAFWRGLRRRSLGSIAMPRLPHRIREIYRIDHLQ